MPLLWISLAFLTGIFLGKTTNLPWFLWVILAILFLGSVFLERAYLQGNIRWAVIRKRIPLPPGIVCLFIALGALRFLLSLPVFTNNDLAFYNNSGDYTITALVTAPPDEREDAVYLEMEAREIENPLVNDPSSAILRIGGKARVRFLPGADWEYGDLLRFNAAPLTPPDGSDFSYKDFLSQQHIHSIIYYPQHVQRVGERQVNPFLLLMERLRQSARNTIFRQFPQPESGLLAGILLGLDNDLPASLKTAYQDSGTAHIIAISGFNMAVLAGMIMWIFSRIFNRYWAVFFAGLVVIIYSIFVGGSASVVRAAVMALAAYSGHLIGRRQSGLNALGFTAAILCVFNPTLLWDVSFQLSFSATLGLVLFSKPLQDWALGLLKKRLPEEWVNRIASPLSNFFLFTLAAQVTTLPLIAIHFGRISVSSLLANPLILPVQPLVLVLGGISTFSGMLLPALGKMLSMLVWPLLAYTNRMTVLLARIEGGSLVLHPRTAVWIAVLLLVFILLFIFRNFFKNLFGRYFIWLVLMLVLVNMAVWSLVLHQPDGKLHLKILRIGDESTLFMQLPDGETLLFDPGRNVNELSAAISQELSPWNFHIDNVWLTNRSAAQNLDLLHERIPINRIILALPVYHASADEYPVQLPGNIQLEKRALLDPFTYDSGLQVEVIAEDVDSAALYLTFQRVRIMIPNGVDYALINESAPETLRGLTAIILSEADISYIPPRVWSALKPRLILWNSPALSPEADWIGADASKSVLLVTDGVEYQLEARK